MLSTEALSVWQQCMPGLCQLIQVNFWKQRISISRNRRLGEKLGSGLTLEEAKKEVGTIAEGVNSVQSVYDIARKNHLNTPIIDAVWQIVCQGKKPHVLLQALGFIHRGNK